MNICKCNGNCQCQIPLQDLVDQEEYLSEDNYTTEEALLIAEEGRKNPQEVKMELLKEKLRELIADYGPKGTQIMAVRMTQEEVDNLNKLIND